jgi:SAM-dependent methyltransferase
MKMLDRVMDTSAYDKDFFSLVSNESLPSARIVVPLVMELLRPSSVVDVGCGLGAWLRAFRDNGVDVICGIDGDYVNEADLLIEHNSFIAADLTRPFIIEGKYDLAVCIEVAEHLPATHADALIAQLTDAAPAVVFSAAIPGQGGINHVNEQWPEYWRDLFARHGFMMVDAFRPHIRSNPRVAYYIRQNLALFLNHDAALNSSAAFTQQIEKAGSTDVEWVYVELYQRLFGQATAQPGLRQIIRELPAAIERSIRRRVKRNRFS